MYKVSVKRQRGRETKQGGRKSSLSVLVNLLGELIEVQPWVATLQVDVHTVALHTQG